MHHHNEIKIPTFAVTLQCKYTYVKNIAIFASGTGSNARKIVEHFAENPDFSVKLLVSNRADAPVLDMAAENGIATLILSRKLFYESEEILTALQQHDIDLIALAGFLWLVPPYLVKTYKGRMVNIHPALLPDFGGKGMHGIHVHEAVKAAGVEKSGITIHFVNEQYDKGSILFQASCPLSEADTPQDIARKVLQLEHRHYAPVLEQLLTNIPKLHS